jgi:hypothetical protein
MWCSRLSRVIGEFGRKFRRFANVKSMVGRADFLTLGSRRAKPFPPPELLTSSHRHASPRG